MSIASLLARKRELAAAQATPDRPNGSPTATPIGTPTALVPPKPPPCVSTMAPLSILHLGTVMVPQDCLNDMQRQIRDLEAKQHTPETPSETPREQPPSTARAARSPRRGTFSPKPALDADGPLKIKDVQNTQGATATLRSHPDDQMDGVCNRTTCPVCELLLGNNRLANNTLTSLLAQARARRTPPEMLPDTRAASEISVCGDEVQEQWKSITEYNRIVTPKLRQFAASLTLGCADHNDEFWGKVNKATTATTDETLDWVKLPRGRPRKVATEEALDWVKLIERLFETRAIVEANAAALCESEPEAAQAARQRGWPAGDEAFHTWRRGIFTAMTEQDLSMIESESLEFRLRHKDEEVA